MSFEAIIDYKVPVGTAANQVLVWNPTTKLYDVSLSLSGLTLVSPDITGTVNAGGDTTAFGGDITALRFISDTAGSGLAFIFKDNVSGFSYGSDAGTDTVSVVVDGAFLQDWSNNGGTLLTEIYSDLDVTGNITVGQYVGQGLDTQLMELDGANGIVTVDGMGSFKSTGFPVLDVVRDSVGTASDLFGGASLERIMSATTAVDDSGIGFVLKTPNDAGDSTFAGVFGGVLVDVSDGAEIGAMIFNTAWQGENPTSRKDLQIIATSPFIGSLDRGAADIFTSGRLFTADDSCIGGTEANERLQIEGGTGETFLLVHDNRSATGDLAGIKFSTVVAGQNAFPKSMIAHQESGAWGFGDMVFCVDPSLTQSGVTIADEVMRLTGAGNVVATGDISGVTLTAGDGFTGTGAYTNFTITAGIITAAS